MKQSKISLKRHIWIFCLALALIITVNSARAAELSPVSKKQVYSLGESVMINVNVDNLENYEVFILFGDNEYRYLGVLQKQIEFRPTALGDYRLNLINKVTGATADSMTFSVIELSDAPKGLVWTDKLRYMVGEKVKVSTSYGGSDYDLVISSSNGQYRYLGPSSKSITFRPSKPGEYEVIVRSNGIELDSTTFTVETPPEIRVGAPSGLPLGLDSFFSQKLKFEYKDNQGNKKAARVSVKDESGQTVDTLEKNKRYRFVIGFDNGPIEKIEFDKLAAETSLEVGVEEVDKHRVKGVKGLVQEAFAIDPSSLDFDSAVVTKVASGSTLYKCAQWDYANQTCYGAWIKIQDITPGEVYTFEINSTDPGFAETGVATVNTNKSVYHPGEIAKITMVVLDTSGYLVRDADVELIVTDPMNIASVFSTTNSTITEVSRGIYVTYYPSTSSEGDYSLFVRARGPNVDSNMSSYFAVRSFYKFDILRDSPVTIDPWQGPFNSSIRIVPLIQVQLYDFVEVLPVNFTITNPGGATESVENQTRILRWNGLTNESRVSYSSQAPLVSPDLYELGPGSILYGSNGQETFTEARVWYLAIDPAVEALFIANQSIVSNGSTIKISQNFTMSDRQQNWRFGIRDDGESINLTSCSQGSADFVCVSSTVNSESCSGTVTAGGTNCTWHVTDCRANQAVNMSYVIRACDRNEVQASFNILSGWGLPAAAVTFVKTANVTIFDTTYTNKTVIKVGEDTSAPWATINQTPQVNITLNENGYCRMSDSDETYSSMVDNTICSGGGTKNIICLWNGTALYIGNTTNQYEYLYVACNDTSGNADNTTTNLDIQIQVLCDSHTDCFASQYCRNTQVCVDDALTGFSCAGIAYGGGNDDAVCGGGASTAKCVDDSSYISTGWYCSLDNNDCVYNDNGNSYDLNYRLCNTTGNDYKSCGASNTWAGWTYCADQWTGTNKSATASTHIGYNCSYYSSSQTCSSGDQDSGSYGCSGLPTDCGAYIYSQGVGCGSAAADCDVGCGASCDTDNSTAPTLISGICYYDKTCSNLCAWSESSEIAPVFCINDYDGGACAYTTRTNPTAVETCYWNRQCYNVYGANLSSSGLLTQDYCDYCDSTGNHSGGYAPAPNASCSSGCADIGTIYYDSLGTPVDRSNDCNVGISAILNDTLQIGDVWTGTGLAACNDTECSADCGVHLIGQCLANSCICTDATPPLIDLISPSDAIWQDYGPALFQYNVNDSGSGIDNCSLILNQVIVNTTLKPVEDVTLNFIRVLQNGTYNWSMECYDNSSSRNYNRSENRTLNVDTTRPQINNPGISGTSFSVNSVVCLNVSVSDTYSGVSKVRANIQRPGQEPINRTLSDTETSSCDNANGNGVYSSDYLLQFEGNYNWTASYAFDTAGNQNSLASTLNWNVSAGGDLNVTMNYPTTNIRINQTAPTNVYQQNCTAQCLPTGTNCANVTLYAEYNNGAGFISINTTNLQLASDKNLFNCGNLSKGENNWWNNTWLYRKQLNIINKNTTAILTAGYTSYAILNTTGAKFLPSGNDTRIVYWNGSLNIELDRINDSAFNSTATKLLFKLQRNIDPSGNDINYYIYYGNANANPAPANQSRIYDFFDDFSGGLGQWNTTVANNNRAYVNTSLGYPAPSLRHDPSNNSNNNDTRVITSSYRVQNAVIDYDVYLAAGGSTRVIHQLGFRVNSLLFNNGYGWRLQNSAADGGWLIFSGQYTWTMVGTAYAAVTANAWHHVQLNITDANYSASVDNGAPNRFNSSVKLTQDYLVSQVHGTTFTMGNYALVDNIKVRKYFWPEPNLTLADEKTNTSLIGASCNTTFTITAGQGTAGNTWPIRCKASSANSPTTFSNSANLSINAPPTAALYYPQAGSWLSRIENLNGSSSLDPDGNIILYSFEIDNSASFGTPQLICSTSDKNCTFNTLTQSRCTDSVMGCYLRLNVSDNDGLKNSTYVLFGIDNTGPSSTLDRPVRYTDITTPLFMLNASFSDSGVGSADTATFLYSADGTSWSVACSSANVPFNCSWDIASIGLGDAINYQIRAYANDTLGNIGANDTHMNITIDRNPPNILLEEPLDGNWSIGYVVFRFNVSDGVSGIRDCSLIVDSVLNQTIGDVAINVTQYFNSSFESGAHSWRIDCADLQGNGNSSATRTFNIDNTGPIVTLMQPANGAAISGADYVVNASVTDLGIGNISTVTFLYRYNNEGEWATACDDGDGAAPYNCTWDLSSLEDGNSYQVEVWANDTFGNIGSNDTHFNITIDNYGPNIVLVSPDNGEEDLDGNVRFYYQVNDLGSDVYNCTFFFNNTRNATKVSPIVEGLTYNFTLLNLSNGDYYWNISCFDDFATHHINASETRLLTVNIQYVMNVSISKDKSIYEMGNELSDTANFTTNVSDLNGDPLDATVATDVIKSQTSVQWWNSSWQRRRPITINETGGIAKNATILLTANNLNPYIKSCTNEIRVIENNSIRLTEIPVEITTGDDLTFCTFTFKANVSANTRNLVRYYVYYNNTAAANPNYAKTNPNGTTVYDYVNYSLKGHTAYNSSDVVTKPPTGGPTVTNEVLFTSGNYGLINSSDNVEATTRSANYRAYRFAFKIAENTTVIRGFNVSWEGYSPGANSVPITLYVWNYSSLGWRSLGTHSNTGADQNITAVISGGFSDLINLSGIINFVVETEDAATQTFYTDYVKLTLWWNLTTGYQAATLGEDVLLSRGVGQSGLSGKSEFLWATTGQQTGNYTAISLASKALYSDKKAFTFFEIVQDSTVPNVVLNSPSPGTEVNASVYFTYIVNDTLSSIKNCTLYIDYVYKDISQVITEGVVQPFSPRIPQAGWHNWSVNCTDNYGNIGASPIWDIWVKPPDLTLYSSEINFSSYSPIEGENVTISSRIYNIGGSDAFNITVQFWDGDWLSGTMIGGNITIASLSDPTEAHWNQTVNISWKPSIGPHNVYLVVDPPLSSNGSLVEINESNNYANKSYHVSTWTIYYGNASGFITLPDVENKTVFAWSVANYGNIYVAETGSQISWTTLQAIGVNTSGKGANNDFQEMDASLNMTNAIDSTYRSFTNSGLPRLKGNFTVYGITKLNVSLANSSNTSNFMTGILWDTSDQNTGEYNGTQDLVFVSRIATAQGKYGRYDYEIRVPAMLRQYKESQYDTVSFYAELS